MSALREFWSDPFGKFLVLSDILVYGAVVAVGIGLGGFSLWTLITIPCLATTFWNLLISLVTLARL